MQLYRVGNRIHPQIDVELIIGLTWVSPPYPPINRLPSVQSFDELLHEKLYFSWKYSFNKSALKSKEFTWQYLCTDVQWDSWLGYSASGRNNIQIQYATKIQADFHKYISTNNFLPMLAVTFWSHVCRAMNIFYDWLISFSLVHFYLYDSALGTNYYIF